MLDDDQLELVRAGAKGAVEGFLKPIHDLIEELVRPSLGELSKGWRDYVRVWRLRRASRHAARVQEYLRPIGIERRDVPLRLVLRSIEEASIEDDDELQDRWAALLANAANPKAPPVHPAFISALRELTSIEVRVLDWFYERAVTRDQSQKDEMRRKHEAWIKRYAKKERLDQSTTRSLIENPRFIYKPEHIADFALNDLRDLITSSGFATALPMDADDFEKEQWDESLWRRFDSLVGNLRRLNLIRVQKGDGERQSIAFTEFGYDFATACRPPSE